jgi:maleylpyruvate isomerase
MSLTLYDYWRSSAAYRVRIALNLKGLAYESVPVHLVKGEQRAVDYRTHNPAGLVPTLSSDKGDFTQSLSIIEYLNDIHPAPPLLPSDPEARAQVRAIAQFISCELHPLNNLRVREYLKAMHVDEAQRQRWAIHWLEEGLTALEEMLRRLGSSGKFCCGTAPTLADICLVPQLYTTRRFMSDLRHYPTIVAIDAHCATLPAFIAAQPEKQPDAVLA